jgi:hypothetical protein
MSITYTPCKNFVKITVLRILVCLKEPFRGKKDFGSRAIESQPEPYTNSIGSIGSHFWSHKLQQYEKIKAILVNFLG